MNANDIAIINRYVMASSTLANRKTPVGIEQMRKDAIAVYHRNLQTMDERDRHSSSHMCFMAEVDSTMPDLMLRARYRKMIQESIGA